MEFGNTFHRIRCKCRICIYIDFTVRHCSLCMIKTTQFRKKVFTGEFPMHRFQPQTIYTPIRYWLHRFIVFLPTISLESVGCFKIKRMIFQRDKTLGFSLYYILTPAYSRGIVTRNLIFKLRDRSSRIF